MTEYLITHDTIAFFLILGVLWLIAASVPGMIYLARFSPSWFCCLLSAIGFGATRPYHFSIKEAHDRRHAVHAQQQEITLDEYRQLRHWIAGVPHPPNLTEVLADGMVSRGEYQQLHAQLDSASLQLIKQQLVKGGEP